MTYEELVEKVKKAYESANAKKVEGHIAVQFNVEGEAEGAFYLEVADGNITVAPFEYYDRDVVVTTQADVLSDIADGKLGIDEAYNAGKLRADGNVDKALSLSQIKVKKTAAKKPAATKTAETKKTAAKKTTAKKSEVKADETKTTAKKVAETKTAEVNETAKKEEKKAEVKAEETVKAEKTTAKKATKETEKKPAAKTTKKSTKAAK